VDQDVRTTKPILGTLSHPGLTRRG